MLNQKTLGVMHMPSTFQPQSTEERMKLMFHEKALMLRITDFLLKEQLLIADVQRKKKVKRMHL